MIIAAIASAGAVLFTMYDPGEDKGTLILRTLKMFKEEKVNLTIPYYWQAVKKTEASICLNKISTMCTKWYFLPHKIKTFLGVHASKPTYYWLEPKVKNAP